MAIYQSVDAVREGTGASGGESTAEDEKGGKPSTPSGTSGAAEMTSSGDTLPSGRQRPSPFSDNLESGPEKDDALEGSDQNENGFGSAATPISNRSIDSTKEPNEEAAIADFKSNTMNVPVALNVILDMPICSTIELAPLQYDEVRALLAEKFKGQQPPDELVDTVLQVSSGNPFWCTVIARDIAKRGIKEFTESLQTGTAKGSNPFAVLILCRLDLLTPSEQTVVKSASIFGEEFLNTELAQVLPVAVVWELKDNLKSLVENGFIRSHSCSREGELFSFQNKIIQTTIYSIIPCRL